MNEKDEFSITVPLTEPDALEHFWRMIGALEVAEDLKEQREEYGNLPGLGMAIAIADGTVAEMRARMAGHSIRAAQAAGHDILKHADVLTALVSGKPVVQLKELDLLGTHTNGR